MIWEIGQKVFGFLTMLGVFVMIYRIYKNDTAKKAAAENGVELPAGDVTPPQQIKQHVSYLIVFAACYGVCYLLAN